MWVVVQVCGDAYQADGKFWASNKVCYTEFVIFTEKQSFSFLFQFSLKKIQVENFQVRIYIPAWVVPYSVHVVDLTASL